MCQLVKCLFLQACYVQNQASVIVCPACQTPRPGHEAEVDKLKAAEPKKDSFAGGFKFGAGAVQSTTSGQTFTFGNAAPAKKGECDLVECSVQGSL